MPFDSRNHCLTWQAHEERERIADATRAISAIPTPTRWRSIPYRPNACRPLRIDDQQPQLRELEAKIQAKFIAYGLKVEQMTEFGKEIHRTTEMMTGITTASDSFLRELEQYEIWNEDVYQNPLP